MVTKNPKGNLGTTSNIDWAGKLRKLLQTMCHRRAVLAAEGANAFPTEELDAYLQQYDELVEEGMAVQPEPEKFPGNAAGLAKENSAVSLNVFGTSRTTSSVSPEIG